MDQGVHLGVNRPAKLIVLAGRNIPLLANAIPKVDTVGGLPRGAIIAGADYLIVFDDHRAESAPETRAAHCHSTGDIQVILALGWSSFHFGLMSWFPSEKGPFPSWGGGTASRLGHCLGGGRRGFAGLDLQSRRSARRYASTPPRNPSVSLPVRKMPPFRIGNC